MPLGDVSSVASLDGMACVGDLDILLAALS
jgi:hypothetical protein